MKGIKDYIIIFLKKEINQAQKMGNVLDRHQQMIV